MAQHSHPDTWAVVGRVRDRNGHLVPIYEPFAEALAEAPNRAAALDLIGRILRRKGITPTEASLSYYYDSARRYIKSRS